MYMCIYIYMYVYTYMKATMGHGGLALASPFGGYMGLIDVFMCFT